MKLITGYWYWWLLLLAFMAFTVWVWKKALSASGRRRESLRQSAQFRSRMEACAVLDETLFANTPQEQLLDVVMYNLWNKLNKGTGSEWDRFQTMTAPQQTIFTVWQVQDEVLQDGIRRFFKECSGTVAPLAPDAFESIGAHSVAQVLEKGCKVFDEEETGYSADAKSIAALDAELRRLMDQGSIHEQCTQYILQHKDAFLD